MRLRSNKIVCSYCFQFGLIIGEGPCGPTYPEQVLGSSRPVQVGKPHKNCMLGKVGERHKMVYAKKKNKLF
jgi:hypothetical protein